MTKQQFMLFRSLSSLIFIYAGIKHVMNPDEIFKRLGASSIYSLVPYEILFRTAILFSGVVMILGGLFMLAGFQTRKTAVVLLAMIIPITLTTQLENLDDLGPFFKNVAIAGSLLLISKTKIYDSKKNVSPGRPPGQPGILFTNETRA
ncbi:MAG TPA: DoxX family protein [Flavisolibacter sp.]